MILNVLPLALGVYPGLASAPQLFLSILVHRPILPRLSSANQGYASDVEIKIVGTLVKTRIFRPPEPDGINLDDASSTIIALRVFDDLRH